MLRALEKEIAAKLGGFDPQDASGRVARLKKLQKEVAVEIKARFDRIAKEATGELAELASDEARWKTLSLKKTANAVGITADIALAPTAVLDALVDQPVVLGGIAADYWKAEGAQLSAKFAQQMQLGVASGEGVGDLIKRVRGSKAKNFSDGIMAVSRRNAESLARTSVNSIANAAHMAVYKQNADVVEGVQHYSVLDSRTTVICSSRHGHKWTLDGYTPVGHDVKFQSPPLHWRCRSIIVSVLDMETPPVEPSFDDWFNGLTPTEQNDLFGGGRAQLWREGRISQSDLLNQSGRPLSLAELRSTYDQGVDPNIASMVAAMKPQTIITKAMKAKNGKHLNKLIDGLETKYSDAAKLAVDEALAKALAKQEFFGKGVVKKAEKKLGAVLDKIAAASAAKPKFDPANFGLPALPTGSVSLANKTANAAKLESFLSAKVKSGAWQQYGNEIAAELGDYLQAAGASKLVSAKDGPKFIAAGAKLKAKATGLQPIVSPAPAYNPSTYTPPKYVSAQDRLLTEAEDYLKQPNIPDEFKGMSATDLRDLANTWGLGSAQTMTAKNGLSAFENRAINYYTGSAYRGINTDLRGARSDAKTLYAKVINGSLKRMKAPSAPPILYRGVGTARDNRWEQAIRSMTPGSNVILRADGINSFSTQTNTAASFGSKGGSVNGQSVRGFIWQTTTTKSARVISGVSSHQSEAEWLFADGSYFKVTKVEVATTGPFRGYAVVDVEEVLKPPASAVIEQAKVFGFNPSRKTASGAVVGTRVERGDLRTARQKATDYTVANTAKTGHEYATVIDDRGKVLWKGTSKQADSVGIGGLKNVGPGRYVEIHHSHPIDQSLSVEDLLLTSRNGRTNVYVYAHTPAGGRYKARVIKSLDGKEDDAAFAGVSAKAALRKLLPTADSEVLGEFSWHFIMLALKREGYIQYAASLSPAHRALIAELGPKGVEAVVASTAQVIKRGAY